MGWRPRDKEAFAHALLALLPLGEVWPREPGSVLVGVMTALAGVVARWAARVGHFLLVEAFPPTSHLLLSDWERVLGLPEPCLPAAQTLEERRLAVVEKLARRPGGQSRPYYIDLARRLGYHEGGPSPYQLPLQLPGQAGRLAEVTIREFRPFMAGLARAGDPRWRCAPPRMRFCWVVTVPGQRLSWFRAGGSRAGQDPHLRIRRADDLECILQKYRPGHTRLIFAYTGV